MAGYELNVHRHTEVHVHRAGAIGNLHVPMFAIIGDAEMPDRPASEDGERWTLYVDEGRLIADTLIDHLAGGVLDQVLVRLLERKAGQLRIAQPTSPNGDPS